MIKLKYKVGDIFLYPKNKVLYKIKKLSRTDQSYYLVRVDGEKIGQFYKVYEGMWRFEDTLINYWTYLGNNKLAKILYGKTKV